VQFFVYLLPKFSKKKKIFSYVMNDMSSVFVISQKEK
jgi:hypothetical protein